MSQVLDLGGRGIPSGFDLQEISSFDDVIREVQRLIELSARHDAVAGDKNGAVFIEADLSILSSEPVSYDRYVRDVRREYAHVDEEAWRAGRSAVLRSLLELVTDDRARSNLARELSGLAVP